MTVTLASNSGFCPGVKRADEMIGKIIKENPKSRIYTLGQVIHNKTYTNGLRDLGVNETDMDSILEVIKSTKDGVVLIGRTHGVTKDNEAKIREMELRHPNFKFYDTTCPLVKKLQKIAEENTSDDTFFLLFSDPGHPEAISTLSYAKGEKLSFSSLSQVENMSFGDKKLILASQTTQNLSEFKKIKIFFKKVCTNAIFFDTICNVTEKRQNEAIEIAKTSDAMIVIGGKTSANTHKLYDLCHERCERTVWIESLPELKADFLTHINSVVITAGASTPDGIILEFYKAMETEIDFKSMLEDSLKTLHTGDTVTGTIVTIGKNEIKLDLGTKFTGVLDKEQITDDPSANLAEMFKIGDEIEVFVIRVEDGKGLATVSKKRVDADNSWVVLKEAYDNGTVLEGNIKLSNTY